MKHADMFFFQVYLCLEMKTEGAPQLGELGKERLEIVGVEYVIDAYEGISITIG